MGISLWLREILPIFDMQKITPLNERGAIMANKRELKQMINNVCEQLFAECMAVSLYEVKPDQETLRALLTSILLLRKDYVARISHPEPGMPQKQYYKVLLQDFRKHVNELIDQVHGLA